MKTLSFKIENKIAIREDDIEIVCGNVDYIAAFTFDSEWDEHKEKTACFKFVQHGQEKFIDVTFTGNSCSIPPLSNVSAVTIGVYAGELTTTTGAVVKCRKSILCGSGIEESDWYALGKQAEWEAFWDAFQQKGDREKYMGAFSSNSSGDYAQFWTDESFKPKHDIVVKEERYAADRGIFQFNSAITQIPVTVKSAATYETTFKEAFHTCKKLKTIKELYTYQKNTFDLTFNYCEALESVTFKGAIANDINLQWSPKLTDETLISLALALMNYDGKADANTKTVYLPDSIKERLYDIFIDFDDAEWGGCTVEEVIICKAWNY